jgi:hypothetical protein
MTTPKKRLPGQTEKLWVRIRISVDGRQVDDSLLILGESGMRDILGPLAVSHGEICNAAESSGRPYLVEFEFWDGEFVRWGTDPARMAEPIPMKAGLAALLVELERRWGII